MAKQRKDETDEGREDHFMDVDRMVNEGLGGGQVTIDNGFIGDTTTDTMNEQESVLNLINRSYSQSNESIKER